MTKPTSAQSDQSLRCALSGYPSFLHADSEDCDQTGRMPRLIWVFAGRTDHCVGFVIRRLNFCIFQYFILTEKADIRVHGHFCLIPEPSSVNNLILKDCSGVPFKFNDVRKWAYGKVCWSLVMAKICLCHMRTARTLISLRIRAVWSASLSFIPQIADIKQKWW